MGRPRTIAASVLVLAAGCGMIRPGLATRQAHRPGAVSRTFDAPVNRVLMAAVQGDGQDFLFEDLADCHFPIGIPVEPGKSGASPKGSRITNDELTSRTYSLDDLYVGSGSIAGKTRDGRAVTLWLVGLDQAGRTEASVFIGEQGDEASSRSFLDHIADRLARPAPRPESGPGKAGVDPNRDGDDVPGKGPTGVGTGTNPADVAAGPRGVGP